MRFERDASKVDSNLYASPLFASLFEDNDMGQRWARERLDEFVAYTELDGRYASVVRMTVHVTDITDAPAVPTLEPAR